MNAGLVVAAFFVGILAILILITLHEFGHFVVAKLSGAYVYEFSIGFGPRIFTKKGKETWFSIRAFPLGGFVSIASDRSDPPVGREEEAETVPDRRKMDYLARWKKALFILAGPVMNFAIAIIMFSVIFLATMQKADDMTFNGNKFQRDNIAYNLIDKKLDEQDNKDLKTRFESDTQNVSLTGFEVVKVKNDSNVDLNTLTTKDLFTNKEDYKFVFSNLTYTNQYGINADTGIEDFLKDNKFKGDNNGDLNIIDNPNDIKAPKYSNIVYNVLNDFNNDLMVNEDGYTAYIRFTFRMMDENLSTGKFDSTKDYLTDFSVKSVDDKTENPYKFELKKDKTAIGITPPVRHFSNTTEAYKYSWKELGNQSLGLLKAFGLLFTGHINQLSGPVGVANQTADMIKKPDSFFLYVAGLSANLFVLNLLPIPPLDGYKFVENAIEAALRREVKQKTKIWLYTAGAILFIVIFVVITLKDLIGF